MAPENTETALVETLTTLGDAITALGERLDQNEENTRSIVTELLDDFREGNGGSSMEERQNADTEVEGETSSALDMVSDIRYQDYEQGDYELAKMIMDASHQFRREPLNIEPSDEFMNAYRSNLPENYLFRADDKGNIRASMETTTANVGVPLIGAQYLSSMWESAKNEDSIVGAIRSVPMSSPTVHIPIDGDLPQMFLASEQTGTPATNYIATLSSETKSDRLTVTSQKFTIQEIWSGELDEDSIINWTPYIRERLNMAFATELGSSIYNGDTTNANNGNINLDDANPDDVMNYLAYDGIRHTWLVDNAGDGIDAGGAITAADFLSARSKLGGLAWNGKKAGKNLTHWGKNARELQVIMDWDTYLDCVALEEVETVDKYGNRATIYSGELASIYGMPIMVPAYAPLTEDDGKLSDTLANNTKGQVSIFNPRGMLQTIRRDATVYFDRIQGNDQYLLEFYTRRGFVRWGTLTNPSNVAAGIRNITV